ncbi:MAG: metallophosphoesterase [Candidatus Cloacimonetes bacterium]|nr:metallophosphoesterase [Candidatus Cloacimonadota bacterium]MDY0171957.1 metallophosphoesterase [Candidatus Cloacimonadaceae bacterium]
MKISLLGHRILFLLTVFCLISVSLPALSAWNAPGDTLSVIMRPILNIPAIHIPGETLVITALAAEHTTGFAAALLHGSKRIPLQLTNQNFNPTLGTWALHCPIPAVAVYELYDLELTANGGIHDITQHAVKLLPTRKSSYYFVHLTDLHLPNRVNYPNSGYDTDSTEVVDFRAVIDDINLINPEFVLITGDLINEGELENLAGQYWYGWTQRLLALIEVPVYVVSGNHDIGGWNSTPGPQGSARRHWWRYFGWPWLNNSSTSWAYHTQDYSFDYGDVQYIGLETYINYDRWRNNIYGNNSMISSQRNWLENEIALSPASARVLFYHYDFDEEIYLDELNTDLSLWGHTHQNSGSTTQYPFNLSTKSVCGSRSYRTIKVNGTTFIPQYTVAAGSSGTSIYNYFLPSNEGIADSVSCTIINNQNISYDEGLIKFIMPPGNDDYQVYAGILQQVDRGSQHNVCYVKAHILPNLTRTISIAAREAQSNADEVGSIPFELINSWPNPFSESANIHLKFPSSSPLKVSIYNLRGAKIRDLYDGITKAGDLSLVWDGKDQKATAQAAGIYFLKAEFSGQSQVHKLIKY